MHRRPLALHHLPPCASRRRRSLSSLLALAAVLLLAAGCAPGATSAPTPSAATRTTFVGVGLALAPASDDGTGALVIGVLENSPAQRAGVPVAEPPARLIAVDGRDVRNLAIADIVDRIRGPEGEPVVLRLQLPAGPRTFTLLRERLQAPAAPATTR